MSKDISLSEFIKAKTELRDNIRDAVVMFVEDFYNKTGIYPDGGIAFSQQYAEDEQCSSVTHLGMTIEVSITTDLEYDD